MGRFKVYESVVERIYLCTCIDIELDVYCVNRIIE